MVICNRCKKQVRKFEQWNGEYFCNNCCYEIEELEKAKQNVCDSTRSVYPLLADVLADVDKNTFKFNHGNSEVIEICSLKLILRKYFS